MYKFGMSKLNIASDVLENRNCMGQFFIIVYFFFQEISKSKILFPIFA